MSFTVYFTFYIIMKSLVVQVIMQSNGFSLLPPLYCLPPCWLSSFSHTAPLLLSHRRVSSSVILHYHKDFPTRLHPAVFYVIQRCVSSDEFCCLLMSSFVCCHWALSPHENAVGMEQGMGLGQAATELTSIESRAHRSALSHILESHYRVKGDR